MYINVVLVQYGKSFLLYRVNYLIVIYIVIFLATKHIFSNHVYYIHSFSRHYQVLHYEWNQDNKCTVQIIYVYAINLP